MFLRSQVRLVCIEMGAAFEERGTVTPPWRSAQSLLSKWLPTKVHTRNCIYQVLCATTVAVTWSSILLDLKWRCRHGVDLDRVAEETGGGLCRHGTPA